MSFCVFNNFSDGYTPVFTNSTFIVSFLGVFNKWQLLYSTCLPQRTPNSISGSISINHACQNVLSHIHSYKNVSTSHRLAVTIHCLCQCPHYVTCTRGQLDEGQLDEGQPCAPRRVRVVSDCGEQVCRCWKKVPTQVCPTSLVDDMPIQKNIDLKCWPS